MIRGTLQRFAVAAMLLLTAGGCASQEPQTVMLDGPLTPMPGEFSAVQDPGNGILMQTVENYLKSKGGPAQSQYEFTRIDLNGDGRREGIILLSSPHHYWCGINGCSLVVFKAGDDSFTPMAEVGPVRGPLVISDNITNGWRDIIVHVSGRMDMETKDVALRFNGRTYPQRPSFEPALYAANRPRGTEIFPR